MAIHLMCEEFEATLIKGHKPGVGIVRYFACLGGFSDWPIDGDATVVAPG